MTEARKSITIRWMKWRPFALGFSLFVIGHFLTKLISVSMGRPIFFIFLATVVLTVFYGGLWPALLVTVLASADMCFNFLQPVGSFAIKFESLIYLCMFVSLSVLISALQVRRRAAELEVLQRDVLAIANHEQRRISRSLDERILKEVEKIAMLGSELADRLRAQGSPDANSAQELAEHTRGVIRQMHNVTQELSPTDLATIGLAETLQMICLRINQMPGMRCELINTTSHDPASRPRIAAEIHLFRIAQDAIEGAIRNGQAKSIRIELSGARESLSMRVIDDGKDWLTDRGEEGIKLRLMAYRAKVIRGSLNVRPRDGGGTIIEYIVDRSEAAWHNAAHS